MLEPKLILLIEDNRQDELLTIRALRQNGIQHQILVCRDGVEALDWIFRRGSFRDRDRELVPTVTLLDLKLPRLDGHEVLAKMRAEATTKNWPVVVLTSSKEESDVDRSYENGANSYVQKPVNFAEFSEAIKNLGIYWLLTNHPPLHGQVT